MRLVIVDDDPFVCGSLNTILGAQPDIEVVATGHDGDQAESLYRTYRPDILLTDIQMPGRDGLAAAATILSEDPAARIVLLTTFADDEYIVQALRLGAKGYLIKQDVATIAPALRLVMAGQSVLGSEVMGRVDRLVSRPPAESSAVRPPNDPGVPGPPDESGTPSLSTDQSAGSQLPADSPLAVLTPREFEVTELVARGLDNRQIAAQLFLGEGTVRNLISAALQKLDLKNRTQLAVAYYRNGKSLQ